MRRFCGIVDEEALNMTGGDRLEVLRDHADVPVSSGNQRGPRTRENRAGLFVAPVNGPIGPVFSTMECSSTSAGR